MADAPSPPDSRYGLTDNAESQKVWYSEQVTGLVRTLGLAAFASAWLFAGALGEKAVNAEETLRLLHGSCELAVVAVAALLALSLDFLQMLTGAIAWGVWGWCSRMLTDETTADSDLTLRVSYWLSGVLGLNAYLATGGDTETLSEFRSRLRKRDPKLLEALAEPRSSGLVTLLPFVFFFAKCAALTTSYVALLVYVW